ncbi:hypothetical protein SARC_08267 [Sphaeroforma arctica JP610]|uniref:Carbohydrate kinase PfkB domain-containing protein n=1 Tax=Sphaeroforma arctica JP610 TaxID=667725 RepID=A0A0L0FRE7_9EUKA|nr:hypothetical protein SARC_08267 [Sphaeroforma arctica JP610]KNC79345.1 hypothetical protein SARC_08267 [Sphaeroforma arctica JP610]|eukprot:XP_014153247.1 hypothetical protein SARC_08267 [Sphaeroforma arctica JP610]
MTAQDIDVVVVGSCNVDYTCFVESPPNPGETISGENFRTNQGGKGANVCVMAARCGAKTAMAGKIGADVGGDSYACELRKDGIDTSKLLVDPTLATGTALIIVDAKGENQIVVCAGANGAYSEEDVKDCESLIERCIVMVCQLEIPYNSSLSAAQSAKAKGVFTLFNPSPMPKPQAAKDFIKHVDCLVVNEHEAAMLTQTKEASINEMATELLTMGPAHVIITMGGEGQTYVRSNAGYVNNTTVEWSVPIKYGRNTVSCLHTCT